MYYYYYYCVSVLLMSVYYGWLFSQVVFPATYEYRLIWNAVAFVNHVFLIENLRPQDLGLGGRILHLSHKAPELPDLSEGAPVIFALL